jgi:hypothetical protein
MRSRYAWHRVPDILMPAAGTAGIEDGDSVVLKSTPGLLLGWPGADD